MGLKGKLGFEIEIRSSGDLFHELFASKPHHISNISPSLVQGCELHEGEFGKNGSVILFNHTLDGKPTVCKKVVENLDEVNKTLTYRVIEGDVINHYKTFLIHLHVTPEAGNTSIVKCTLEYEKLHEDVPHPISFLDFALNLTQHIEAYHLKAQG